MVIFNLIKVNSMIFDAHILDNLLEVLLIVRHLPVTHRFAILKI